MTWAYDDLKMGKNHHLWSKKNMFRMAGAILCCKLNCGQWRVIVLWMHLYGVKSFFPEVCQCRYCYAEESRTCCRIQARRHMFCSLIKYCRRKMLHTFPSVVRCCFFWCEGHGKLLCKSFFGKDAILKLPIFFSNVNVKDLALLVEYF